ncbi:armadillo-type protein [Flagelloscypha sp. PMI_526]|nr:armadillo-type protein [Flagelloscypha sp. PMI_526]
MASNFVSFFDSGSLGRSHYMLVRNIESDPTTSPDRFIHDEIRAIKQKIQHASLKECKEYLVTLMYSSMASSNPYPSGTYTFAIPYAINLAEAGKTIQDKRIGYLYCSNFLSSTDELSLMLVNTLRKDLESLEIPRICLAADYVIQSPNEDTIPAIESRLFELLSHNSPSVRRRALLAFKALCPLNPELLFRIESKILKRLRDEDQGVVNAALFSAAVLVKIDTSTRPRLQPSIESLLLSAWADRYPEALHTALHAMTCASLTPQVVPLLSPILRWAMESRFYDLIRQVFLSLQTLDRQIIWDNVVAGVLTPVQDIRLLLRSNKWNHRYLFLTCLESLDPAFWAGTTEEIPAVLEEEEVGAAMRLLDSKDHSIRIKTLLVLDKIDNDMLAAYYGQALQSIPNSMSLNAQNEFMIRLLEILDIQFREDGAGFAEQLAGAFRAVEAAGAELLILEETVEMVLVRIREGKGSFRIAAVTYLAAQTTNQETKIGPTLFVIVSALLCEYFEQVAIAPAELLQGMSRDLTSYPAPVQDACILAMLRILASCEVAPESVVNGVSELGSSSRRYIRKRCEQFVELSKDLSKLKLIVGKAKSSSLPDFLEALQGYSVDTPSSSTSSPRQPAARLSPTTTNSKLRYEAYAKPTISPRLRGRRLSSSSSTLSLQSLKEGESHEALSQTLTPGDLALVAGSEALSSIHQRRPPKTVIETKEVAPPKEDLIAFDSPFFTEPPDNAQDSTKPVTASPDFAATWNAMEDANSGARGWCQGTSEGVLKIVQDLRLEVITVSADEEPFTGELKILVDGSTAAPALLRVRDTDDGCLWRLRSTNDELRLQIKRALSE